MMTEFVRLSRAKQEEIEDKKQRSKLLFNSDILSDVKFVVRASLGEIDNSRGKITIPAHKFVLSVCSPVFFSMFCGEMAETQEQIDLPDCEYEGMFELLRYIYTDEVCLNGSNVMQVLYLAEKYLLPCLSKECDEFLKENLDPSDVLCVLQHAQKYKKKDLLCQCWYLIDKKTEAVLKSSEFLTIEKSFLEQLVVRNSLNIQEVELFKAVDYWAEKECERQNLTADAPFKRQILGEEIIKNIRFPAMKQSDFTEVVFGSKMLTQQEISQVMDHFSSALTSPVTFLEAERGGSCLRCCRIPVNEPTFEIMSTDTIEDRDVPDIVELTVDKDILLYGVTLFGNEYFDFSVTLKISKDGDDSFLATKSGTYTSFYIVSETDSLPYYGLDVLLDVPVTLEKDESYCFEVSIVGPFYRVDSQVAKDVECAGVHFNFNGTGSDDESDWDRSADSPVLIGSQIAEVLFKLKD